MSPYQNPCTWFCSSWIPKISKLKPNRKLAASSRKSPATTPPAPKRTPGSRAGGGDGGWWRPRGGNREKDEPDNGKRRAKGECGSPGAGPDAKKTGAVPAETASAFSRDQRGNWPG